MRSFPRLPACLFALAPLPTQAKDNPAKGRPPAQVGADIDRIINQRLASAKVPPSPRTEDGEFIRRATIDLIGRIPIGERAGAFLDSKDADKRRKLIDELLASPEYGRH